MHSFSNYTVLGFPQTMQVAVSVNAFDFIPCYQSKSCFRSIARFQVFSLYAILGGQNDEFNIMFCSHRMFHRANGNIHYAVLHFINRYVFFFGSVNRIGDQFTHFFAAADYGNTGSFYQSNDLTTMGTFKEFRFRNKASS